MKRLLAMVLILGFVLGNMGCVATVVPSTKPSIPQNTVPETNPKQTQPPAPTVEATQIPTIAPTEDTVSTTEPLQPEDTDFALVADYVPNVKIALAYATQENFTGSVIYGFTDAYLRYGTVVKLRNAAELLEHYGYGILVWDAFRPVSAQQALWDACPDANFVSPPGTGFQAHCRGMAVDITIYSLTTGELVAMPSGFDEFSSLGDRDYSDCSVEVRENARILETIMENCGFTPYFQEWWHYSDEDTYEIEYTFVPNVELAPDPTQTAATEDPATEPLATEPPTTEPPVTEPLATEPPTTEPPATEPLATEPSATEPPATEPPVVYEGMETVFGSVWVATCNKSMALRAYASTDAWSRATIYPGDELILLEWKGKFAHVAHEGKDGYVLCQYMKPAQENPFDAYLSVISPDSCYTYEEMTTDLQEFADKYPDIITLDSIGLSHWGTQIPVMCVGDPDATTQILVQAAIHGREHITAWLTMALAEYWIKTSQEDFPSVCIRLIPMMNPDGVKTSQTQTLTEEQLEIYHSDVANGYTDLSREEYALMWKANGVGIDLNRNFDADWNSCDDRSGPSAMLYAGTEPFSALETAALRDYTLSVEPDVTLSFHSCGNLIFYDFGSDSQTNRLSKSLAQKIRNKNGYWMEPYTSTDSGGYKDWAIDKQQIPSLTIEVGNLQPVSYDRECYYIFAGNCDIFSITAKWLTE